jgi:hypothetical protein
MATAGQSAVLPIHTSRPASVEVKRQETERNAGRVLFLSGVAYAAAYVVVGITGLFPWGALLAVGGTALVLLGLGSMIFRSS